MKQVSEGKRNENIIARAVDGRRHCSVPNHILGEYMIKSSRDDMEEVLKGLMGENGKNT